MMNSNKIGKREINEELINVWAMMILQLCGFEKWHYV